MPNVIVIPKETKNGENRVAMTPSSAERLTKMGFAVRIESGAGAGILVSDSDYKDASFSTNKADLYASGNMILKVQPPTIEEVMAMQEKSILISFLYPHTCPEVIKLLCTKNITSFAMEMIPRISRAQSVDALSSQATIAGYKAVLIAANAAKFFLPMLTTAAGSIRPAKVMVVGVGVAGLQAIATAKRLGAIVEAYDVRLETKEQVESLGAKFIQTGVKAEGAGGYARELNEEEIKMQRDALQKHIAANDIIITTAGVPGRPAPKIIFKDMIEGMKPGSVIVDIMAENGGNCDLVKAGSTVMHNGVSIIGTENIYSFLAINASEMYARNILNLLELMVKEGGTVDLDWKDDIILGSAVTHEGKIINERVQKIIDIRK